MGTSLVFTAGILTKQNVDVGEVGFGIESMHGMRDAENNRRAYGDSAILRAVSLLLENLWADARLLAFTDVVRVACYSRR